MLQNNVSMHARPDLLQLAWKRKWLHLAAGLAVAVVAVGAGSTLAPRYKAATQLLVDPRDIKVLDNQLTPAADAQNIGITLVESQVMVLGSDSILKDVAERMRLAEDPEFNGRKTSPIRAAIGNAMQRLGLRSSAPTEDERATAFYTLQRNVRVRRIDRTYVIEATTSAETRDKATGILQTMLTSYLDDQAKSRSDLARRTGHDLDTGVASLRANLEIAEKKLAAYTQSNNLVGVRGQSVTEQQFTDINTQLINARVEASRLEARRNAAIGGFDNLPEALASPTLRDLRANLARAAQQKTQLESQMLPGHPAVRVASDNERKLISMINTEVGRIRDASDIELRRAKANERELERQLAELRQLLNRSNNAQIELRELERDVEVNRNLYRQAMTRTREAQEQSRVNTANVRIISAPNAERDRIFPPPATFLALFGFGLGAMLSLALLFMRQLSRSSNVA